MFFFVGFIVIFGAVFGGYIAAGGKGGGHGEGEQRGGNAGFIHDVFSSSLVVRFVLGLAIERRPVCQGLGRRPVHEGQVTP